jgi:hypothetical protein
VRIVGRFTGRSGPGRRAAAFFVAAAMVGLPAGALRVLCLGNACELRAQASSKTPFCSLPDKVRRLVEQGFYEGRSPDIMAVTGPSLVAGGDAFRRSVSPPLWPSTVLPDSGRVPLLFGGMGVTEGAELPAGTGLDDVSETIAAIIDLRRPHPDVRSGDAIKGVASGQSPRLVLEIVWKGMGSDALERRPGAWPRLKRLMDSGAGTMDAVVGSLPLDPAATITTIGTGGLPSRHGVTGSILRGDEVLDGSGSGRDAAGKVVRAWGRRPFSTVIATLGDHLDERLKQKPIIGLVGTDPIDRGLIGGDWYVDVDREAVAILDRTASVRDQVEAARDLLTEESFGRDEITDLAGVVLAGPVAELDAALKPLVELANRVSRGSAAVVITATGVSDSGQAAKAMDASSLRRRLERSIPASRPLIEALVPGGLYLDQDALARLKLSDDVVLSELLALRSPSGERVMADAFPAIAITFGRYC